MNRSIMVRGKIVDEDVYHAIDTAIDEHEEWLGEQLLDLLDVIMVILNDVIERLERLEKRLEELAGERIPRGSG